MAGLCKNLGKALDMILRAFKMEPPELCGLFLGCNYDIGDVVVPGYPRAVRTVTYSAEPHLRKSVKRCLVALPLGTTSARSLTPMSRYS